jgi:predicted esterase YcpF (UPF0227 family)
MNRLWLLKTEPSCYSWDDLKRDKKSTWDGISNATALKHLRTMKKGDLVLIYHTADERAGLVAAYRAVVDACERDSGALLPHLSTVDMARDLDRLRAALGDRKLTYVGESYGTFLGTLYATLFPERVRALVFDGAIDPTDDGAAVALGTNLDDLGDVRPGITAALERGAKMPLVEAGLTKPEVRALSHELGLRTWDKPQLACLSSRFPYGTQITPDRLRRVDAFEDGLRALGFRQLRVRFHDTIARLEIDPAELAKIVEVREAVVALGKRLGFTYVAVDLGGFRSGSLNEVLPADALVKLRPGRAS